MKSFVARITEMHETITHKRGIHYRYNVKEDYEFLDSIPEPRDDFERSFDQFLCQQRSNSVTFQKLLYNAGSAIVLFPSILSFRIRNRKIKPIEKVDAVMTKDYYERKNMPRALGETIRSYRIHGYDKGCLSKEDMYFVNSLIRRYPTHFFFLYKCIVRIAAYSEMIRQYDPMIICASCEYSCTSSVLTAFCESKKKSHINIMHGEKLFNLRESFCRFSSFYLWDEFYKDLFLRLRADQTEYHIEKPDFPQITDHKNKIVKYYLQLHTDQELRIIKECLDKTKEMYLVRPHPSHFTRDIISVFGEEMIENPKKVNIWDSLGSAKEVVSINSTVLLQAYWNNIPVIIDNISNPELFNELKDRRYIMMYKPHKLMSEMLNPSGDKKEEK